MRARSINIPKVLPALTFGLSAANKYQSELSESFSVHNIILSRKSLMSFDSLASISEMI